VPNYLVDDLNKPDNKRKRLVDESSTLDEEKKCLVNKKSTLVNEKKCLVDESSSPDDEKKCLVNESSTPVNEKSSTVNNFFRYVDRNNCLTAYLNNLLVTLSKWNANLNNLATQRNYFIVTQTYFLQQRKYWKL